MAFELSTVACDAAAIEDGALVEIYPGWKWRVRSAHSRTFVRGMAEIRRRVSELPEGMPAEEKEAFYDEVIREFYARKVVVGWEEAVVDGEPLVFSPDAAVKILGDQSFPDLKVRLSEACSDLGNFRAKRSAAAKNA